MISDQEARVDRLRRANRLKAVQQEMQNQYDEEARNALKESKVRSAARDQALSDELSRMRQEEIKQEKILQMVREHPELRELEQKLKAAHVAKGRVNQIEERKQLTVVQAEEDRLYMDRVVTSARKYEAVELAKRQEHLVSLKEQAEIQRSQQAWKIQQQAEEAERRRKEKAEVDAIVSSVQEQDFMEQLSRVEKQRSMQKEHDDFCNLREKLRREEQARLQSEEQAILAYMAEQNKRKESDAKLRQEKETAKARILEEQGKRIAAEKARREELEMLINEYYEEQRAAKVREEERQERLRRELERDKMIAANQQQMQLKALRREQELAEEQIFRQKMLEKFAEDDRLEQQSKARQKQLKLDHAKKVSELLEEKRRQREEDLMREAVLAEQNRQREEELKRLIAQERARMLEEHAPQLGSFMPKGLTENDWELLRKGQQIPQRTPPRSGR
jgi:hypothetical protein